MSFPTWAINNNISVSGNLENLGLKLTPEASKLFKGNFSLVIENKQ
jgi:hypothetical protein